MITYRLGDALPKDVMQRLTLLDKKKDILLLNSYWMQVMASAGWLTLISPKSSSTTRLYFAGKRYTILAYVVMPNHVHVLIRVFEGSLLAKIVQSWKSYTAKQIATQLSFNGQKPSLPIWQPDYWDRFIRNQAHLQAAIAYIHNNPVSAGLVAC